MRVCPNCQLRYYDERTTCLIDGTPLEEHKDKRIGQVLAGRYALEEVLGEGGMATVYRAHHTLVDRPLAVKVLHPHLSPNEDLRERMRREGRSAAALTHPNIIEIYDYGETPDGSPFLVMELLEGKPLNALLAQARMPLWMIAELGTQIARGLARAHDFGIVHRDLKPENIFICKDDNDKPLVKLVDFGIARAHDETHLTKAGMMIGTPQYMAPERATSKDVGLSSDLYSLGVVLYEMVTGRLPFYSKSATGFLLAHMHDEVPNPRDLEPSCPEELESLILRLLSKDPKDRPVDAHQVVDALSRFLPKGLHEPVQKRTTRLSTPENTSRLDRWVTRVAVFERMLEEAYPEGGRPKELEELLDSLEQTVADLRMLREAGLGAQRQLDTLETESRNRGMRLGHAAHVVAQDLSRSREELRVAEEEVEARRNAVERAQEAFRTIADELHGLLDEADPPQTWEKARTLADQASTWQHNEEALIRSAARVEARRGEVEDLEFQVGALREQLAHLEEDTAKRGADSEAIVKEGGEKIRALEEQLLELSARFCQPLRDKENLAPLFAQLSR